MISSPYTTQLQAGLGMIDETNSLLSLWRKDMSITELSSAALDSGVFPQMSARRVRNVVAECFAPRYMIDQGRPASWVKQLKEKLTRENLLQVLFIYTCRANQILADFVRQVYWPAYAAGKVVIEKQDAIDFVVRSNQDGLTSKLWSESTVKRVSSYLIGCCADFGLLAGGARKSTREINAYHIDRSTTLFLAYDLHLSAGQSDNAMIANLDWRLFGLETGDVIAQLRQLMTDDHFVIQSAGGLVNIAWKYKDMESVINVIR